MSWISYAQNGEDVLLMRAFGGQPSGFYIDIGANDAVVDSVTKALYDRGWCGVNVEASPRDHARLAAARPRDVNLCLGCSDRGGVATFYQAPEEASGLSTFSREDAARHEHDGFTFNQIRVPIATLRDICTDHVQNRTIDFLKVDVEGHESAVLQGADFSRWPPRVVIVEATRPRSQESTHHGWEHVLLDHGYIFAVFDGLNRWYVHADESGLVEQLTVMPNVFDDYVPYRYQHRVDELEEELARYRRLARPARALCHPVSTVGGLVRRLEQPARKPWSKSMQGHRPSKTRWEERYAAQRSASRCALRGQRGRLRHG